MAGRSIAPWCFSKKIIKVAAILFKMKTGVSYLKNSYLPRPQSTSAFLQKSLKKVDYCRNIWFV